MKRVYFNEYNLPMGNAIYLPLATGMLRAYAETIESIKKTHEFMPFIFKRASVQELVDQHDEPDIVCFSVSMWNYNLSLAVARKLKLKFSCKIIVGGPSAPLKARWPIDEVIRGEGEHAFAKLLEPGIKQQPETLDDYPSPYTAGIFDYLMDDGTDYQAIIETNRGCPYGCAFCCWGSMDDKKYRFFSLDYIKRIAFWIGQNKIKYVFCADSNFGTFKRDVEIATIFADVKEVFGYPEKFRVCYGKVNNTNVFNTAKILDEKGLSKSVTISVQTTNEEAAAKVGRRNIKKEDIKNLRERFAKEGISTYSEFILGLPGETRKSFMNGINEHVKYNDGNKLFIYHCSVLPNTEMAEEEYQKKHGINTVRVPIAEIHCSIRSGKTVKEYEDIIIETNTLSVDDWLECTVFAWVMQLKYGLNYHGIIPQKELWRFYYIANKMLFGSNRCQILSAFGNIYWEPEEAAYLRILGHDVEDKESFAREHILFGRKNKAEKQQYQYN